MLVKIIKEENVHTGDIYAKVMLDGKVEMVTLWLGESDRELTNLAWIARYHRVKS